MRSGLMLGILAAAASGGGGSSGVNWANVSAIGASPLTKANAAQTIVNSGTLNLSHSISGGGTLSWTVYKNGASQGAVASLAVAAGDTVYFSFTLTGTGADQQTGTFTVSGAESDTFTVDMLIESGA